MFTFPLSLLILPQSYELSNGDGELGQYSKTSPSIKMDREWQLRVRWVAMSLHLTTEPVNTPCSKYVCDQTFLVVSICRLWVHISFLQRPIQSLVASAARVRWEIYQVREAKSVGILPFTQHKTWQEWEGQVCTLPDDYRRNFMLRQSHPSFFISY